MLEAIGLVLLGVGVATFVRWRFHSLPIGRARWGASAVIGLLAVSFSIPLQAALGSEAVLLPLLLGLSASLSLLAFPGVQEGHQGGELTRSRCRIARPNSSAHGRSELTVLRALAIAGSARDRATQEHAQEVARLASRLARALGMPPSDEECVYWAALLHDIGKVAIPSCLLRKPASLSRAELKGVMDHSQVGADILRSCHPGLTEIACLVLHHHERWDGSGYPSGFRAQEIPLGARIIAVTDTFEALTSERPYRRAMTVLDALDTIRAGARSHFDPDVVILFERMIQDGQFPDDASPLPVSGVSDRAALTRGVLRGAFALSRDW